MPAELLRALSRHYGEIEKALNTLPECQRPPADRSSSCDARGCQLGGLCEADLVATYQAVYEASVIHFQVVQEGVRNLASAETFEHYCREHALLCDFLQAGFRHFEEFHNGLALMRRLQEYRTLLEQHRASLAYRIENDVDDLLAQTEVLATRVE